MPRDQYIPHSGHWGWSGREGSISAGWTANSRGWCALSESRDSGIGLPDSLAFDDFHEAGHGESLRIQRSIFGRLPLHLARMCLFKVNTGLREQDVCGLRWEWEHVIGDQPSVFVIPPGSHKGGSFHRIVVLNSVARSVIEAMRDLDGTFVFVSPKTKKPLGCLNNTSWQKARRLAGLPFIRIHDLKHTYGERLEAAGVDFEVKQVMLGHKNGNVTSHYSGPRIAALLAAAEKVVTVADTLSIMRVVGGEAKPGTNAGKLVA